MDARGPADVLRPAVRPQVEETALESPVPLDRALPRQAAGDVVVRADDRPRLGPHPGLVGRQPEGRRTDRLLRDRRARPFEQVGSCEPRPQLLHLGRGTSVVLLNRSSQRPPRPVQEDHAGHHPADADGRYVTAWELPAEGADVRPPLLGILLGPAGSRRAELDIALRLRRDPPRRIDKDRLRRRRADVDAEKERHGRAAATCRSGGAVLVIRSRASLSCDGEGSWNRRSRPLSFRPKENEWRSSSFRDST